MKKLTWLLSLIIAFNSCGQATESGERGVTNYDTLGAFAAFHVGIDSVNSASY